MTAVPPCFSSGKNDWMISSSIGVWILSLRYQGGERRRRYKLKTQCTLGPVKLTACDFRQWFLIFASLTEIELIFCNANHSTITKCDVNKLNFASQSRDYQKIRAFHLQLFQNSQTMCNGGLGPCSRCNRRCKGAGWTWKTENGKILLVEIICVPFPHCLGRQPLDLRSRTFSPQSKVFWMWSESQAPIHPKQSVSPFEQKNRISN